MKLGGGKPLFSSGFRAAPAANRSKPWGSGGRRGSWGTRSLPPKKRRGILWMISLLLVLLLAVQSFIYVDRHLRGPIMNVAKVRMNQVATQAINQAITEQVASHATLDKLIDWKTSNDGKVSGFMLNYSEHMKITAETISTVSSTLYHIGEIKESVPVGLALGSAMLASYGPRIPVKIEPVGATQVELNTRESSIGINNTLVEVYIKVKTEISIIIPFDTEPQTIETDIPVSYLLVVGDVPMYYYDNKGNPVGDNAPQAPNISLPMTSESENSITITPKSGSGQGAAGSGKTSGTSNSAGGTGSPPAGNGAGSGSSPAGQAGSSVQGFTGAILLEIRDLKADINVSRAGEYRSVKFSQRSLHLCVAALHVPVEP
ncbi:sporulation protein YunB [Paenibacillus protaetiae]|uniref:Sporulation protein YunB n=2 Tax=Paenibacillus protaetiae TaxID=2509456 RepID=A0A4V0YFP7_9BACL|nr:sporulation protein YunB [Paenibacillus protaetiae]